MYAIVESGGLQFKVEKDSRIRIPKLDAEPGSEIRLDRVLALSDGDNFQVGSPYVKDVRVKAKLLVHAKHEKLVVYKYKRRKNYRRKRGHRQDYSELLITEILVPKALKKEAVPEVSKKEAVPEVSKEKAPPKVAKVKGAPKGAKKKAPVKKVRKKTIAPAKTKKAKPAKAKAEPVKKRKVAKKSPTRRKVAAKPAAKAKKKTTRRVIGRLRRKKEKE